MAESGPSELSNIDHSAAKARSATSPEPGIVWLKLPRVATGCCDTTRFHRRELRWIAAVVAVEASFVVSRTIGGQYRLDVGRSESTPVTGMVSSNAVRAVPAASDKIDGAGLCGSQFGGVARIQSALAAIEISPMLGNCHGAILPRSQRGMIARVRNVHAVIDVAVALGNRHGFDFARCKTCAVATTSAASAIGEVTIMLAGSYAPTFGNA